MGVVEQESHPVRREALPESLLERTKEGESVTTKYRVTIAAVPEEVDGLTVEEAIWTVLLSNVDPIALIRGVNDACYSPAVKAKVKRIRRPRAVTP